MKIFLILSLFLIGCGHGFPKPPKDVLFVLDKKVNKSFNYETPDTYDGKYKPLGETSIEKSFESSETESLYCIRPEFHMQLRYYARDVKKWAEEKCK